MCLSIQHALNAQRIQVFRDSGECLQQWVGAVWEGNLLEF